MNEFLKTREQVRVAGEYLDAFGWIRHACFWKNWDLSLILPMIRDGNLLDMGAFCSYVLPNSVKRGITGEKHGIDLTPIPDHQIPAGVKFVTGDLCKTNYRDSFFRTITCLSVIEHGIDYGRFLSEAHRLLSVNGVLYITFDYWPDRYLNLPPEWNLLCSEDVERLLEIACGKGFDMRTTMDWQVQQPMLSGEEWFPGRAVGVRYTFGAIELIKTR